MLTTEGKEEMIPICIWNLLASLKKGYVDVEHHTRSSFMMTAIAPLCVCFPIKNLQQNSYNFLDLFHYPYP